MGRAERSVLIIGLGVIALVGVSVAVALAFGPTEPSRFPAGSPEDVLQRYLLAVDAGRAEEAYGYLSRGAQAQLRFDDFARYVASAGSYHPNRRIRVGRTVTDGDRVTVYLTIEYGGGAGLNFRRSAYERPVRLVREGDAWKIDEPLTGL
ncbi:MAG: hypothetical protein QJR03_09390 [Sphaerobacter sp.]|nr:hypothetical protein [Sphaerobacter sp.]